MKLIYLTPPGKTEHFLQYINLDSKTIIRFVLYYSFFSVNISLNPHPLSNPQLFKQEEWRAFSNRGLHLIDLNINSLLPKTDELRDIAERTKAAVTLYQNLKLIALFLIQKFTLKIMKFFVSIEVGMKEVLLVTLEVTLTIN